MERLRYTEGRRLVRSSKKGLKFSKGGLGALRGQALAEADALLDVTLVRARVL